MRSTSLSRGLFAVLASFVLTAASAASEYRLSPGDTVEVGVAPLPERTRRVVIQFDGSIVLPEAGRIDASGLTLAEFQSRLQMILPTKLFHFRGTDGREQVIVVKPDDVTASIAEYRPVYVTGDVLTPGQQVYRPMMTVRQVIAASGGYSLLRSRTTQGGPDPVDLQRDYESLWTEYLQSYFRVARTRAELQGDAKFDTRAPDGSPLPPTLVQSIVKAEGDSLATALSDRQEEKDFLGKAQKDADEQIALLLKRQQDEEAALKADEEEMERLNKVYEAGNLTNARLADVRRAVLLSSTRLLDTSVELMRTRRQKDEYARQLERSDNQARVTLLRELNEATVRLADLGVRIRAAGQKLQPAGAAGQPLPIGNERLGAEVTIVRKVGDAWQKLPGADDAEVMPGDVVEARFASTPMTGL